VSLFELKNPIAVDLCLFEKMKKTAMELLNGAEKGQHTQAVVLFSAQGNEYGRVIKDTIAEDISDEMALIESLKAADDTEIKYILCMWQGNTIDIPSYRLREMLRELNCQNAESVLIVMTVDGISGIKVAVTMK
jgi:hypothetical protein